MLDDFYICMYGHDQALNYNFVNMAFPNYPCMQVKAFYQVLLWLSADGFALDPRLMACNISFQANSSYMHYPQHPWYSSMFSE